MPVGHDRELGQALLNRVETFGENFLLLNVEALEALVVLRDITQRRKGSRGCACLSECLSVGDNEHGGILVGTKRGTGVFEHTLRGRQSIVGVCRAIHPMIEIEDAKGQDWSVREING